MDIELVVFRGERQKFFRVFDLRPILRHAAVHEFGDAAKEGKVQLTLGEADEPGTYPGPPEIRNLEARDGKSRLRLVKDGDAVDDRELRTVDLLGPVLAEQLRRLRPGETTWAFRLRQRRLALVIAGGKLAEQLLVQVTGRPEPEIPGSVDVNPDERRHQPFTLTQVDHPESEEVEPADLGLDPAELGKVNVLMPARIHQLFLKDMELATTMEEGGFMLGRVTKAGDQVHLVEITHVTPAHRSGAGMVHFTFTGESFLAVARLIEERGQSEELVGWYHTHLLGVEVEMGLSSIDVDLHLATFQRPWQVAALINIRKRGRTLRFFGRDDRTLREYDQWISDDGGKYRQAGPPVGGE
ncbi:JAB N-terminal domain-containing protein [Amycolatopsis sp. NPDC004747]